ncbi:uncharacterized protein N7458_005269 [Penicillium daleae]|uniref:Uncharacterized protein n=1 Tax=Penicillium daleae TaxID=63821 RepID=A0AAD6G3P3_9EURO|nr:uncharacterized protein N7458_005269 [Penicillium daleae]KAJ5454313.1 hypothetical protein N7458_005269 [Penicillium daleae]
MTMDPTLPAGGFPPTPPQTSEEEKTPDHRLEVPLEPYPPVPMYAINNGLDQGALHGIGINPHSQPPQVIYPVPASFYPPTGEYQPPSFTYAPSREVVFFFAIMVSAKSQSKPSLQIQSH